MKRICVVTGNGGAYYAIGSKLRNAGLPFLGLMPTDDLHGCELVVTTKKELASFSAPAIALEDLDENSDVARGQILFVLTGRRQNLLVGVDPGSRIGTAAFLGESLLASRTFNSRRSALAWVASILVKVPSRRSVVRVGDGDPSAAGWLAGELKSRVPAALVEIVDESGTSRAKGTKGLQKDQGSAARIAMRRGLEFRPEGGASRSR
jgi:hypothetical protein